MNIHELQNVYFKPGIIEMVNVRPKRLDPVLTVEQVMALENIGLEGDHYLNAGGERQVTLIQAEHIEAMASMLDVKSIAPELTRRNLVVRGINLLSLKGKQFSAGDALLEYSGECHPCTRMERSLGPGAYNVMRGHGGITAKVVSGGMIRKGDRVHVPFDLQKNSFC
jgi:MOSC domain-containing protein YiiM